MAVRFKNPKTPKKLMLRLLKQKGQTFRPDNPQLDCLKTLAELPLPVFITTNYDDLMVKKALKHTSPAKNPRREYCRWHEYLPELDKLFYRKYVPDLSNPLVFHLHGTNEIPESIVLTEDDYMDFMG